MPLLSKVFITHNEFHQHAYFHIYRYQNFANSSNYLATPLEHNILCIKCIGINNAINCVDSDFAMFATTLLPSKKKTSTRAVFYSQQKSCHQVFKMYSIVRFTAVIHQYPSAIFTNNGIPDTLQNYSTNCIKTSTEIQPHFMQINKPEIAIKKLQHINALPPTAAFIIFFTITCLLRLRRIDCGYRY